MLFRRPTPLFVALGLSAALALSLTPADAATKKATKAKVTKTTKAPASTAAPSTAAPAPALTNAVTVDGITADRCAANKKAGKITYLSGFDYAATASIVEMIVADAKGYFA